MNKRFEAEEKEEAEKMHQQRLAPLLKRKVLPLPLHSSHACKLISSRTPIMLHRPRRLQLTDLCWQPAGHETPTIGKPTFRPS